VDTGLLIGVPEARAAADGCPSKIGDAEFLIGVGTVGLNGVSVQVPRRVGTAGVRTLEVEQPVSSNRRSGLHEGVTLIEVSEPIKIMATTADEFIHTSTTQLSAARTKKYTRTAFVASEIRHGDLSLVRINRKAD
jgi:hypothetical protein